MQSTDAKQTSLEPVGKARKPIVRIQHCGKPASRGRQENTGSETHTRDQNMNEVGFREMLHSADESRESEGERCV